MSRLSRALETWAAPTRPGFTARGATYEPEVQWTVMRKTTLYLPAELKVVLERAAEDTQRTESEIIREGLRLILRQAPPAPRSAVFDSGDGSLSERFDDPPAGGFGR